MSRPESAEEQVRRLELEEQCRRIGRLLVPLMPKSVGFTLVLYNFGGEGSLAYMSNGDRADMICAMKECVAMLEGRSPESSQVPQ